MKICNGCNTEKPLVDFHRSTRDGIRSRCKTCRADEQRRYLEDPRVRKIQSSYQRYLKYGITEEQWQELVEAQQGRCAICGCLPTEKANARPNLCIDHNHKTKRIRGLLCTHCNSAIALLGENSAIVARALGYLRSAGD